jgi:hypothetical protein
MLATIQPPSSFTPPTPNPLVKLKQLTEATRIRKTSQKAKTLIFSVRHLATGSQLLGKETRINLSIVKSS